MPTFSVKPLSLAVIAALALSSPVVGKSMDKPSAPAAAVTDAFTATVLFGDPSLPDARPSSVSRLPVLRLTDAGNLDPGASRHVLAVVNASSLPLGENDAATLARLFKQGMPVLVRMDSRTPDDLARVSAQFGTAPNLGDMIVRNDEGAIGVFASASDDLADTSALLDAIAESAKTPPPGPDVSFDDERPEADAPDPVVGLPMRTINVNLVDPMGEIAGVTTVEVVRSRTIASDFKLLRLSSKATIAPSRAGVIHKDKPHLEVTTHLPHEYNLRHDVAVRDGELVYLDHFPVSDGSTEFSQSETKSGGFTIGGSMGSEYSVTGKDDPKLAAKLPFNVSVGYEQKWQSTLTNSFKDYSLQAGFQLPTAVAWTAPIAPQFKNLLRSYVDPLVIYENPEKKMTPMMKVAAFDAASYWQMPGTYEGPLSVTVSVGYKLDRDYWFYPYGKNGTRGEKHESTVVNHVVRNTFYIPMSDPYLTAELTVLIRSATESGQCLRDNSGIVDLVACQPTDSSQQWGFDEASRYVNRKSKKCLTAQPAAGWVVTESCGNLTFEKQWQWRADRLHSLIDHELYRMYVAGGQVLVSKKGRFPDFPANFSSPALEPWTNYPAAPRKGIDLIVGRAGTRPMPVGPEYASLPAVTSDQRWRIEVLRQGL